jgi:hypothetical protein
MSVLGLPLIKPVAGLVLAAASLCPNVGPPQIAVEISRQKPLIHHEISKDELKGIKINTDMPYQMQDLSHVETGGMMRGDIHVNYKVATSIVPGNTVETVNMDCVRYDTVTLTLDIAPVIYIAKEYEPGSCWYDEILQHEMGHIDADQTVVEKYQARIRDGLNLAFSQPGDAIQGPVDPKKAEDLKKTMGKQVMDMTDMLVNDMARDRAEAQQSVDSLGGYAYIMNKCSTGDKVYRLAK